MKIELSGHSATIALILLFATCTNAQPTEVRLGVITELSGAPAPIAADCRSGFQIALRKHSQEGVTGNKRLRLIYADTRDDPKTAITEWQRLVTQEDVHAVFTTLSKIAMPLNPLSRDQHIALLSTAGHSQFVAQNPYAYRFFAPTPLEGNALAHFAVARRFHSLAVVTVQEEWQSSLSEAFVKELKARGISPVYEASISSGENDYAPYATLVRTHRADAVLVNLALDQIAPMARRLRELGFEGQILTNYRAQYHQGTDATSDAILDRAVFFQPDLAQPNFDYEAHNEGKVSNQAVAFYCYTALAALIEALKESAALPSRQSIADAMNHLRKVALLDGELLIENREAQYRLAPYELEHGTPHQLRNPISSDSNKADSTASPPTSSSSR